MNYQQITNIPSIPMKIGKIKGAKITIAIPTYKRVSLLKEAIDSCLSQRTEIPFNILIVDNDPLRDSETEQLIDSFNNQNISYYKNSENIGATGNWNKLFELADTEFVTMLHDDDLLEEDYIEKMTLIIEKYKSNIDAIYTETRIFSKNSSLSRKQPNILRIIEIQPFDLQFYNICSIIGACFKREKIIELNGFDNHYYPPIDYQMHLNLSKHSNIIKIINYPLTLYRILENDSMKMSTIFSINVKDQEIQNSIIQNYPIVYKKLFHIYQKNRELLHYIGTKRVFGVNSPEINQKITELKNKITFIDKLIFLGWRVFIKLHFILKPKTTIKL